jgi:hypothetical protein
MDYFQAKTSTEKRFHDLRVKSKECRRLLNEKVLAEIERREANKKN